jgi:hypothetical protein
MATLFLALSLDENPAWYGLASGVGHMVLSPVTDPGGDHIGSGTLVKACDGKPLDADRAEGKFTGDRMCTRCLKWQGCDGYRDTLAGALDAYRAESAGPTVADMIMSDADAVMITLDTPAPGPVPGDVSDDTPGNTDRVTAALAAARENVAASVREVDSRYGTLYAVESGGRWHVGDSRAVATADSEFYAMGEPGDDVSAVVSVVCGKMLSVADSVAGGTFTGDADAMRDKLTARGVLPATSVGEVPPVKVARKRAARFVADNSVTKADMLRLNGDAPSPNAERDELRDAAAGVAAKRPRQARAWARVTDGKCAVVLPADGETPERVVTLSGRMLAETVAEIAALTGCGSVPVGKSAAAVAPVTGSDAEGITGTSGVKGKSGHMGGLTGKCPVCRQVVTLTGSGGIGTHRPDGSTPDAPQLSQRIVPAVDRRGEPTRDAAKRRTGEAYREVEEVREELTVSVADDAPAGVVAAAVLAVAKGQESAPGVVKVKVTSGKGREGRTSVVSTAGEAQYAAPVRGRTGINGARNHGRGDGVAMLPRGESGYAGFKFDDGGSIGPDGEKIAAKGPVSTIDPIVGGDKFGTVRESEYLTWSASKRRAYRRKVAQRKAVWSKGAQARKAERAAKGSPLTSMVKEAEQRRAKEARKSRVPLGSGRRGNGGTSHLSTAHTDVIVTAFGREPRSGRDIPADADK